MKFSLFAIGISLTASSAAAETLSWPACVTRAQESNGELQAARHSFEASDHSVSGSYSTFLPQVSGSLGYTNADTGDSYSASVTASENLFNGFIDAARVSQAKATREIQRENLVLAKSKVSADLKTAFAGLQYAQSYVTLTQDIIGRREANLKLVSLAFESGRENRGSLELSRAYLLQAKYDRLQAQNGLATARAELARVLGMEDPSAVAITGELPLSEPPASWDPLTLSLETPEVRQAQAQESSADAAVTVARGGFFPSLSLSASAGRAGPDWFPDRDRWSVGAALTLPLFNGGRDFFGTKAAAQNFRASSANLASVRRLEVVKLRDAHATFAQAIQKLEVDQAFVQAAVTREKIGTKKYNNGLLSFEDWDIIENDLIARQKTALQSRLNRVSAEAAWERAIGKGVIP